MELWTLSRKRHVHIYSTNLFSICLLNGYFLTSRVTDVSDISVNKIERKEGEKEGKKGGPKHPAPVKLIF